METFDLDGNAVSVGMKALADWEESAVFAVERLISGYEAWISDNGASFHR